MCSRRPRTKSTEQFPWARKDSQRCIPALTSGILDLRDDGTAYVLNSVFLDYFKSDVDDIQNEKYFLHECKNKKREKNVIHSAAGGKRGGSKRIHINIMKVEINTEIHK